MTPEIIPTINGQEYSWCNISAIVLGQPVLGVLGVSYKSKKAKTVLHASGRYPRSIQHGKRESDGTLTILQSEFIALNRSVKAAGYADLLDVDIDILVKYSDDFGSITIDKIHKASFTELPEEMKEGDANMTIALPFIAMRIEYNIV